MNLLQSTNFYNTIIVCHTLFLSTLINKISVSGYKLVHSNNSPRRINSTGNQIQNNNQNKFSHEFNSRTIELKSSAIDNLMFSIPGLKHCHCPGESKSTGYQNQKAGSNTICNKLKASTIEIGFISIYHNWFTFNKGVT